MLPRPGWGGAFHPPPAVDATAKSVPRPCRMCADFEVRRGGGAPPAPPRGAYASSNLPRPDEALDGRHQLGHLVLASGANAVAHVILDQLQRHLIEGRRRGRDLGHDVDAVPLVLDHALKTAHLPL